MSNWFYKGRHGFIISELETMRMMVERVFDIVETEIESAHKRFLAESKSVREEYDFQLEGAREQLWISSDIIPKHIMISLFISIFALFEDEMVSLCELAGMKSWEAISANKFKNWIGLTRVKVYMKELQINVGLIPSWEEIMHITNLRNMVLHNNGRLRDRKPDATQKLSRYIDSREDLTIDEFGLIVFNKKYLNHIADVFRSFLKDLFPKLETRGIVI